MMFCLCFVKHFKPTQSALQSWYQLGYIYSSQCKDQTEFMSKLCNVANNCSFANRDEIVKFLFLTHNTNKRVNDELIEKMKTIDTLADIFQLAETVESTVQTDTLSEQLLQNTGQLNTTTEMYAVQKCHQSKNKCFQSNSRSTSGRKIIQLGQRWKEVVIVVVPTFQSNVLPTAKNVSNARKKNNLSKLCWSSEKKPGSGVGNPKHFSRKDIPEVEKPKFEFDTDILEFKQIQFSTPVFNSKKDF